MKQLSLPDGIRSTVYGIIIAQLKADPTLSTIITPDGWTTYADDAEVDDSAPPGSDTLPAIEILPYGLGASPASLVTQEAPMGISINLAVDGIDVRDLLNLWEAVEGALFRGDGSSATLLHRCKAALTALGRGQIANIRLTAPAITTSQAAMEKQQLVAAGTLLVELRIPK